ncbi:MAG: hypothetical protein U0822_15070 [Anaerolineae bacterium]
MAVPSSANYVFLPWVRQGAAAGIQTVDSLGASQPGVVSVAATLRVNDADDIGRQVRLYGPGDITGIDAQQIVRTEPRPLALDFEPNYFPAIEFDHPGFPWLFTPASADAAGRLRPWLCLVVVRKQDGVTLRAAPNTPLPVLDISAPARPDSELPDLSESWAWAHAQVTGSARDTASLKAALAGDPALTVSRLLCPRRLDPATAYLACLVPTFELGRKAGLGLPIQSADESTLQPAWTSGAQSSLQVTLPVYFYWEFSTGTGGDFEALVRLLQSRPIPPEVGKRPIDISRPGFAATPPLPPDTLLEIEGALRVADAQVAAWPDATRTPFQTALKAILEAPFQAMQHGDIDPLLAPPIYGEWQAARHTVTPPPSPPASAPWLDELNLDPRYRAVAALGTQVVQTQQEQLMASAWEQLGEIQRINQMRRQAQLGRAVNGVYYARHFSRFSTESLFKVVAPAQSRIVNVTAPNAIQTRLLLSHSVAQSALPVQAVSAPMRRLTSARGVISSRFETASAPRIAIIARLNTGVIVPPTASAAGLVTINQVSDAAGGGLQQAVRFERISNMLDTGAQLGKFQVAAEGDEVKLLAPLLDPDALKQPRPADSPDARAFRNAIRDHQTYMVQRAFISFLTFPAPPLNLPDTRASLLQSIDPRKTITARVQASLRNVDGASPDGDPLEPVMDAPEFPQPMYEALRDLSQDFLFPGLEDVPPNTVTLLETNPAFVEAFLVGLNTEMGRELLWRDYPTDQRGSYFRQFWDTSAGDEQPDIPPIHTWNPTSPLGGNAGSAGQLVLLVRGQLLRRYPNSVIYAVAAVRQDGGLALSSAPADERHPLFRGTLQPDVTFLGFDLTKAEAVGDPGWFFVIQQQPTEPRFGMDAADFSQPLPPLQTWDDLSWRHLADTEEALKALSYASIKTALPDIAGAKWGRNGAHQAYITLQHPVRIAIHASEMLEGSM